MKKLLDFYAMQQMYPDRHVRETDGGFEVCDPKSGITYIMPKETDVLLDGSGFDPAYMMELPPYITAMLLPEGMGNPVSVQCTCGTCEIMESEGGTKTARFTPGILLGKFEDITAVLLKIHWDARCCVTDMYWNDTISEAFEVSYIRVVTDDYQMAGDWYWIINDAKTCPYALQLTAVAAYYYSTLRTFLQMADEVAKRFEDKKAMYRQMIDEMMVPLRELGTWSISVTDDETKVRQQKTTEVLVFRHDAVGLAKCADHFQWVQQELDLDVPLPDKDGVKTE